MTFLTRCSRLALGFAALLTPPSRREWISALRAELAVIPDGIEQLRWALGGIILATRANLADRGALLVLYAIVLGLAASYLDIHSPARATFHWVFLANAFLIGMTGPSRALVGIPAMIVGRALLIILLGFPEPYAHDRADILYCIAPAAMGACAGVSLRGLFTRLRKFA